MEKKKQDREKISLREIKAKIREKKITFEKDSFSWNLFKNMNQD